jgi:tetratricopeptide (TPR) repeat protein
MSSFAEPQTQPASATGVPPTPAGLSTQTHAHAHALIERLSLALDAAPLDVALHTQILEAMRAAGDEAGFAAHELALVAFKILGAAAPDQLALVLFNLATVYSIKGQREQAIRWYRHALAVHPELAIAHQNLSALLKTEGNLQQAERHRERAYQLQRVFIEPALRTVERRLLILGTGKGTGNIPIDGLLSFKTTSRIKYAIDYADEAEDAQLPAYDLVFNAIGDPDVAGPLATRISRFAQQCARPVLNPPEVIERTHRHRTAALFAHVRNVIVPPCIRLDTRPANADDLARQLAMAGVTFPLLMRPLATHGGENLALHASLHTLWPALVKLDAACYLTAYHDFRSADGYFRKYRIIYVNREPHAYHLAISPNWMVHYFSAEMTETPWKLDEERRFLADPGTVLGVRAMNAIVEIGRQLDLDYGGIDFTLTPTGQVLVFEANATMLAHREARNGPLAHKNPYVERIADALERMLRARVSC